MTNRLEARARTWLRLIALGASVLPALARTTPANAEDACDTLRKHTEVFSDASTSGNADAVRRLLDDRVVFFNEGGDAATKAEMIASARPPMAGVEVTQTVADFHCELFGEVAVTSFIDDQRATVAGVVTEAKFRSVETWRRAGPDWRMIGSETIALQDDPKAVHLPRETLADYVGTYRDSSGQKFVFAIQGDGLAASVNGGPLSLQKAEVRDVFFTPGRARFRKVFERDISGKVIAFAYRREGHDTVFRRID